MSWTRKTKGKHIIFKKEGSEESILLDNAIQMFSTTKNKKNVLDDWVYINQSI